MRANSIAGGRPSLSRDVAAYAKTRGTTRSRVAGFSVAGLLLAALFSGTPSLAAEPVPIAIIDFDYVDTSGEVRDQTEKHQSLVATLMEGLRTSLEQSGRFRLVSLLCDGQPCSVRAVNPSELMTRARSAGAKMLLLGGIHKESTLVQWAKIDVLDVEEGKIVYDRLLTFRGDDAYAWQRAQEFFAKDLEGADLSK
jgi:hypothetical protein